MSSTAMASVATNTKEAIQAIALGLSTGETCKPVPGPVQMTSDVAERLGRIDSQVLARMLTRFIQSCTHGRRTVVPILSEKATGRMFVLTYESDVHPDGVIAGVPDGVIIDLEAGQARFFCLIETEAGYVEAVGVKVEREAGVVRFCLSRRPTAANVC